MKIMWVIIVAYASLPKDSVGFRRWLSPCQDGKNQDTEPIAFDLTTRADTNPQTFAYYNVADMFNFSWIAYSKSRAELEFYTGHVGAPECFHVMEEEEFNTKIIIANLPDRIVIAFRGTANAANMRTDFKIHLVPLTSFLPSQLGGSNRDQSVKKENSWTRAKIHFGFAVAYKAICEDLLGYVANILSEKSRPILLTGHSLGGALAYDMQFRHCECT